MPEPTFIGREPEKAKLAAFLDQALLGQGQVVFVSGEAGNGKTALVKSFAQEMQTQHQELVISMGNCSAQGGMGDPYLPFRELIGVLTGAVDDRLLAQTQTPNHLQKLLARSVNVLVEIGPDLIGTLIPAAGLLSKIGKAVLQKGTKLEELEQLVQQKQAQAGSMGQAIEQGRIFEQYAKVLQALAVEQPLLLILDDLHWADEASIGLLFHLSRRIETSQIMLLGTYRPDEVALPRNQERNPLEKVLAEIKRYAGDVWINLGDTAEDQRRAFVNDLLDREANALDPSFRQQLFQHTDGHPLFTVELLRSLQERQSLIKNPKGQWISTPQLDWNLLPARVEGVIEERIGRLNPEEREILNVASVEGERFTAEVISEIAKLPMRQLLKELSNQLEKQHNLVQETAPLKSGKQRLSGYRFAHALFQKYLYGELSRAEKGLLHGEVARVLEQFFSNKTEEIAAQLAWHYDQAGEDLKTAQYALLAGERAYISGGLVEAQAFFNRAIELLPETDLPGRWRALNGRVLVHGILVEANENWGGDHKTLLGLAERAGDTRYMADAYFLDSHNQLHRVGDYRDPMVGLELGLKAARQGGHRDLEALLLSQKAFSLTRLGEAALAKQVIEAALICIEGLGQEKITFSSHIALLNLSIYHAEGGDFGRAVELANKAFTAALRLGDWVKEVVSQFNLADLQIQSGLFDMAFISLRQALQRATSIGFFRAKSKCLLYLGMVRFYQGKLEQAKEIETQACDEYVTQGFDRWGQGEALWWLGYISEQQKEWVEASQHYQEARQHSVALDWKYMAIESVAGLARCALAQNQLQSAGQLANEVWVYLAAHGGWGADRPALLYLTCADIFEATGSGSTAREAIEKGYRELIERSFQLSDLQWRKSLLENVPENRELLRRWQEMRNSQPAVD